MDNPISRFFHRRSAQGLDAETLEAVTLLEEDLEYWRLRAQDAEAKLIAYASEPVTRENAQVIVTTKGVVLKTPAGITRVLVVPHGGPAVVPEANPGGKYDDKSPEIARMFNLQAGEPWFLFRAQDKLAPQVVSYYGGLLDGVGLSADAQRVRAFARSMQIWQEAHPNQTKLPD